jgi:putative spermidine/putrescine transport system permease protein
MAETAGGDRASFTLLVAPAVGLALVFYFLPLAQVLWISVPEPAPGLENYALLFTSASISPMLATTARICVCFLLLPITSVVPISLTDQSYL